jgi:hypothetical protein
MSGRGLAQCGQLVGGAMKVLPQKHPTVQGI